MKFKKNVKLDTSQVKDHRWKAAARRKLDNKYKFHTPVGLPKDPIEGVGLERIERPKEKAMRGL